MAARRRALVLAAWAMLAGAARADLPALVERLRVSVLPVGIYGATDSPRFGFRGSGFAVGDGSLVATNFHVLPPAAEREGGRHLAVLVPHGHEGAELRLAELAASDPEHDLALLKIEGAALPPLALDGGDGAREGQSIALIGFPLGGALGFAPVTHRGIVASRTQVALPAPNARALDPRAVNRLREGNFGLLQLDATAYPGNSGGPVFDADSGIVVGIVTMGLIKDTRESAISVPTGITYAVPARYLRELLTDSVEPQTR